MLRKKTSSSRLKSSNTFVVVSDSVYLRYVIPLLNSIDRNCPQPDINLLLINCKNSEIEAIQSAHPSVKIHLQDLDFRDEESKRSYCANCRAKFILTLLDQGYGKLLYLDADSLVRKKLDQLWQIVEKNDLTILLRESSKYERNKCATGIIGVTNNLASRQFLERWSQLISSNEDKWFNDQIFFYRTHLQLKSTVSVGQLPQKFIDWEFHSNSPIWVGKGPRKDNDLIYELEEKLYADKMAYKVTISHCFQVGFARCRRVIHRAWRSSFNFVMSALARIGLVRK